ncbi:Sensor histidine kinase RcsC [Sporomusa paucivorans]
MPCMLLKRLNPGSLLSVNLTICSTRAIIILFGISLLSFLWTGLYYQEQNERQLAIASAFKDTANFARAFEEHTLRTIKSIDQTVLFLKYQYEQEGRSIDIPQYIKEGRLTSQPFVLLSVIDEQGDLAVSDQVRFLPSSLEDCENFKVHQTADSGQLFISKPVLGHASGKWSIQMTRRINKPDGSFGGVAVISIDPGYFTKFYKQVNLGKDSTITLVGRDGIVRARDSGGFSAIGQDMSNSTLMEQLAVSTAGNYFSTSSIDKVKRLHSYRALSDYPFVVSVGISEEEVFRDVNKRLSSYYRIAGISSVVISIFVVILLIITGRQKRTENALKQIRDNLELEVVRRTQELFTANQELIQRNYELTAALETIENAQKRLAQQEKLAGIGQLAAGVAHEINNPLGFVTSNIETLEQYFSAFGSVIPQYRELISILPAIDDAAVAAKLKQIAWHEKDKDLDYILNDFSELFKDTIEGLDRMNKIVKGMRRFSHINQQVAEPYDLNEGLESTLLVAQNEIRYYASVEKRLGKLPVIEAVGSEINQVLLNLIVNAAQAIRDKHTTGLGAITVSTWHDEVFAYCSVQDDGAGIAPENLNNIFNPFFTTKPVGQGSGMGLSISYDIIANHHKGEILVESSQGTGTIFIVKLPMKYGGV